MGRDTGGIFLFEVKYVMVFRKQVLIDELISLVSYLGVHCFAIFHEFRVLVILCSGF